MPGIPRVDDESLKRLRELVARLSRESNRVPVGDLMSLGDAGLPGEWRIDLRAGETLGAPLVVYAPGPAASIAALSPREREVAALIAEGCANKTIADRLGLSIGTVKDHVHNILDKTGLSNRAAIAAAISGAGR